MKLLSLTLVLCCSTACSENRTPYGPDAGLQPEVLSCVPNLDGVLSRDEMPTLLSTEVDYLISRGTAVDLSDDEIDLSAEYDGEAKQAVTAEPIAGQWFASDFPADGIVVQLSRIGDTFAILRSTENAISLLGIASELEDHTLLKYQSPIDLYRFPMREGDSWQQESAVLGTLASVPYNGSDQYRVAVGSRVSVSLPHLRFTSARRVQTSITSDSGAAGVVVTRQQVSLLSECFGEVTRVVSQDNESATNFTTAAELWRFSL